MSLFTEVINTLTLTTHEDSKKMSLGVPAYQKEQVIQMHQTLGNNIPGGLRE
jgi:hypothetical protein